MFKKISYVFISIFFGFLLIELYFKAFNPQDLNASWRMYGKNGLLLNSKNKKVSHYFSGKKYASYTFGEFHNREYGFDKTADTILTLGDSFTFGWLLNDEDTFVFKLNKKIPKYKFINAAAGGWGTSDQLSYFMNFCNIIKPKYTLVFINLGDIERSIKSNLFKIDKNKNLIEGKNEIMKIKVILDKSIIYNFLVTNIHTVAFLKSIYLDKLHVNQKKKFIPKREQNFIFAKKLLLKFKEEGKKCGTKLFFINLGWKNYNTFTDDFSKTSNFLRENKPFLDKNFNYIDLNTNLRVMHLNKTYTIPIDGHPNALGNDYLLDIIYKKINPLIN